MNHSDWIRYGWEQGWCGPPVCATCDGLPCTEQECDDDACIYIVRLYESPDDAAAVTAEHSPSVWRASNAGWTTLP